MNLKKKKNWVEITFLALLIFGDKVQMKLDEKTTLKLQKKTKMGTYQT